MKATLDLRDGASGLDSRDAARLEWGVRESMGLLDLARALVFGPLPDGTPEPPGAWQEALNRDLDSLAKAYRGQVILQVAGADALPGALFRSFIYSLAKLLLPQSLPNPLQIEVKGTEEALVLSLLPVLAPPLALQGSGQPRDLHGIWLQTLALGWGAAASHEGENLLVSIPRQSLRHPPVE